MKNFFKSPFGAAILALGILGIVLFLIYAQSRAFVNKVETKAEQLYNRHIIYDMELEKEFWATKSKLIDAVDSLIKAEAPYADVSSIVLVNECMSHNVDLVFVLAQAKQESRFGTKGVAAKTNSIFNVGAFDGLKDGEIHNRFKYPHPNESIRPYIQLLLKRYLVNKTEDDLMRKFVDIGGKRYASYDKYEQEIRIGYDSIQSKTTIGTLYSRLQYFDKKLKY